MKYIVIFILVYVVSSILSMYQNKNYFKALTRVKKEAALVSTGVKKSYFRKGSIAIIGSNDDGIITYGEFLKGRTVFADFKVLEKIKGLTLNEAKEVFNTEESILQSINFLEDKIIYKN